MGMRACTLVQFRYAWRQHSALWGGNMSWDTLAVIERNEHILSGAWVFRGTRVPVTALFENLRDGATIDQFLEWFPGGTREQVQAVLAYEMQHFAAAAWESSLIKAHLCYYGERSLKEASQPSMNRVGRPSRTVNSWQSRSKLDLMCLSRLTRI